MICHFQHLVENLGSHTYPRTKTPHNFHLINQNGMISGFPSLYKSKEPIKKFYFKKK